MFDLFWCCFRFPDLGMISTIHPLRILIVLGLYQRYHLHRLVALTISPRFLTSNPPILSSWIAQMKVSKDRGWLILLYRSLRFSYLNNHLLEQLDVIWSLNRRMEGSTQIYICCLPVIRTKILQMPLLSRQDQIMGVLERDWYVSSFTLLFWQVFINDGNTLARYKIVERRSPSCR
jgi:hypothetical protein